MLLHSDKIGFVHKGMPLPSVFGWLGQKYFNMQHRFNEFEFKVPFSSHNIPKIVMKRHKFIADIISYNQRLKLFHILLFHGQAREKENELKPVKVKISSLDINRVYFTQSGYED